jgi:hypothetical protein
VGEGVTYANDGYCHWTVDRGYFLHLGTSSHLQYIRGSVLAHLFFWLVISICFRGWSIFSILSISLGKECKLITAIIFTNSHWPMCRMPFVRLTFPYWFWRQIIPFSLCRLGVHGRYAWQQTMITLPRHQIIPLHLLGVCVGIHSFLYLPVEL